jgi:hypothetical protein
MRVGRRPNPGQKPAARRRARAGEADADQYKENTNVRAMRMGLVSLRLPSTTRIPHLFHELLDSTPVDP